MKFLKLEAELIVCTNEELDLIEQELISQARKAAENAYSIYSNFSVGCAILLENREIISANNQENASYPAGACAEKIALMYANANYPHVPVIAISITAQSNGKFTKSPVTPCGICRQVILECENRFHQPIKLYLAGMNEIYIINTVKDILPLHFNNHFLSTSTKEK